MDRPAKVELNFGYGDYLRFSRLLLERCGLYFSDNRRSELEYRLRMAFAASTCSNLDEFYNLLQDPHTSAIEMDILINAMTISETHFFRDTPQFNALQNTIFPKLIERKQALHTLRIWSAGCASGEEAYSVAILLHELIPDIENWSITILGTDINTASLDRARTAVYSNWAFREERALRMRPHYFRQVGNHYELSSDIRRMVTFHKLNLVEPCYPSYDTNTMTMDLILCRNVTIYFSEDVTCWVVDRFYDSLLDGGWLIVGRSEPSVDIYRRYRHRNFPGAIFYQRMPETSKLRWPLNPAASPAPAYIPPPPTLDPARPPKQTGMLPPLPDAGLISTVMGKTSQDAYSRQAAPNALMPVISSNILPEPSLDQVGELLEVGHLPEALEILLKLSKTQPRNSAVFTLLGKTYANLSRWKEAEDCCGRAIDCDKLCLEAYYTLALVHQHNGHLGQAIEEMKKVVYLDRNYILGHYGLANLCHDCGQIMQAQKFLDNALHLLAGLPDDMVIPGSQGVTASRLRGAINRQQQTWAML